MPAFLFMDALSGAGGSTCAAYRYVNGSPTQIGNTFGTSYGGATPDRSKLSNQIIQFQGDLYAMAQDGVYKKDDPTTMTGGWTQQIAFTTPDTGNPSATGLHVADVSGTQYLFCCFCDDADIDGARWAKFDGTTWTQSVGTVDQGTTWGQTYATIVYRNVMHVACGSGGGPHLWTYDPSADSIAQIPASGGIFNNNAYASFCIFQDRLFLMACSAQPTNSIWEFVAGAWTKIAALDAAQVFGTYGPGNVSLFTDGTNMYRLSGAPTQGWRCYQINSALSQSDISSLVLPSSLRAVADGGTFGGNNQTQRFAAAYDTDSAPGSLTITLYHTVDGTGGTGYTAFQWNGPGSLITQVDTGGDVEHAPPTGYPNHGERIWTAEERDIKITGRKAVSGGEEVSFIAYGGGTGLNMKLWYSLQGEPVLSEATLSTPVTGGSATFNAGMNRVEGIAADGATVYTIVWDFVTDGLALTQRVNRVPQVFE